MLALLGCMLIAFCVVVENGCVYSIMTTLLCDSAVQQEIVVLTNDSTRLKKLIATLRSENGDAQTQIAQWKHKW